MTKIVLVFSLLLTFLFSFPQNEENEKIEINTLSVKSENCSKYDSVVNITTTNNLINVSGFIVGRNSEHTYIATSYTNYDSKYNYEIVFSDYSRLKASIVGYAKEDGVLILSVKTNNQYCTVDYSRSELVDKLEQVEIVGMYKYHLSIASANVNEIGICLNCEEETYKNYYYSLLSVHIDDYFFGAGVFDLKGNLIGMIIDRANDYEIGIRMLDVNKLKVISYSLINNNKYEKNYIKYNLLNVNSLTNYDKYLYSLDEGLTSGVLVSSVHYFNYIVGGLNQGMVIYEVNGIRIDDKYELDNELSKYKKDTKVSLKVKTITGKDKVYLVKV